ncbi:MAG TPA: hypothetical protein VHL85_01375 [Burkholderiales bacterium]|jgi:hypothetical protein|nr:hypothetical protein [Burkholderiales bacterium]
MKSILFVAALSAFATIAMANDGYRTSAGESESDNVVKTQLGAADSTQYRNQAGEQDAHQPQVG